MYTSSHSSVSCAQNASPETSTALSFLCELLDVTTPHTVCNLAFESRHYMRTKSQKMSKISYLSGVLTLLQVYINAVTGGEPFFMCCPFLERLSQCFE
jgi:hypothetical protein